MRRTALAALFALALTGCGGAASGGDGKLSSRLIDPKGQTPYVNALDIDPADGDFLLTTNRGFYRIDPKTKAVTTVKGSVTAPGGSSPVGTYLELTAVGPGQLLGSGHPDRSDAGLPSFLGFMRSDDAGRTWQVLSRLGEADLHKIFSVGDKLYAFDAVLGALLISPDGGRTFKERFTPRGLVLDFVVDPNDPEYLLAATEDQLYRSEDEGAKWRGVAPGEGIRLTWTGKTLLRADEDGTIQSSTDRGRTFAKVGEVPGEPYKFKSLDERHHFLALSDGTILETKDAGRTWATAFDPDAAPAS